jgi:adenine/guanine phosphoribosyltransferase-like PRPP-binding protein
MVDYQVGDEVHRWLRGYKDAPVLEAREACIAQLVPLVVRWMAKNRMPLERHFGSPWDLVATVPSSGRPAGTPVDELVSRVPQLAALQRVSLARGPESTDHLRAARQGFVVFPAVDREWLRSRRVLVFDDTVITGARAQSAVAALRIAGARVIGVLAVGRVVGRNQSRRSAHLGSQVVRLPGLH